MTFDEAERSTPSTPLEIALPPGVYTVFWHAESADGTVTEDESTFAVGDDGGPAEAEAPTPFPDQSWQEKAA